jgi:hypothetical protein
MFIEINAEILIEKATKLDPNAKANWGDMCAQRMIEHLSDGIRMSNGKDKYELAIPEDRIEKMKLFLASEKPMAKNIAVDFAPKSQPLRHTEMELAIDELILEWIDFEEYYETNPQNTAIHPYYGALNETEWRRLHSKHFTHHFEQFSLI